MTIEEAKASLDKVIKKARVHLYKPIQIAEILYRDRVKSDIVLSDLETYRNKSKKWRDILCIRFLGRTSTSSAKYQDNLFEKNAVPPDVISVLGKENIAKQGIVEAYIYNRFYARYNQMSTALSYCRNKNKDNFKVSEFIRLFWNEPGLKRSIDKIYEIIVYALFSVLVEELNITIEVSLQPDKLHILKEFDSFAEKVICINSKTTSFKSKAKINRVGVTNAADRGLDMWANFGPAIQIKHLSLNEKLALEIVNTITSDRIVIVCKDSEQKTIQSLLTQLGWKARIQSIITENELIKWYELALRGQFAHSIGDKLLQSINNELVLEFPTSDNKDFNEFYTERKYNKLQDTFWT